MIEFQIGKKGKISIKRESCSGSQIIQVDSANTVVGVINGRLVGNNPNIKSTHTAVLRNLNN